MLITVRLFATLRINHEKEIRMDLIAGGTVRTIIERLGIPEQEATIIFINGRGGTLEHPVSDGDVVSIFPAVGGG